MTAPIISALLVRNEADRYLPEVLDRCSTFGKVVILDDGSTDGTRLLCERHPAVVAYRRRAGERAAWGAESAARAELWDLAAAHGEWILFCDADQLFAGDPRPLTLAIDVNAWAFPIYDLWGDRQHYRTDAYWRAHDYPRVWLVNHTRTPVGWRPTWGGRGVHCGHLPANFPLVAAVAPPGLYWEHLGYVREEDRATKLAQYRAVSDQLNAFERAHAESIGDLKPTLRRLPAETPIRVLVGAPTRKRADVLAAHLDSLAWQELPPRVEVEYCFVTDYPAPDIGEQLLKDFVTAHKGTVLTAPRSTGEDFSDNDPVTHRWTASAMGRVGALRQRILQYASEQNFDYVWMVDTDLICDRTVLASLLACQKPIVSAVYWTRWENVGLHAGPQVWLAPVYELGRGPFYPESEFRTQLAERELVPVGGLGACTLMRIDVIRKGVGYTRCPNFPTGGLWDGEDRHFCEWARRLHVDLWADAWPDIFHVYHPRDVDRVASYVGKLGGVHPSQPVPGSYISLRLLNLEKPIGHEFVRTLLGSDTLLPELADAVAGMQRGQTRIVRVHFPLSWPLEEVRGQTKLLEVMLVDCKPAGLAPVLDDEFHRSPSGFRKDAMLQTAEQNALLQEPANAD